MEIILNKTFIDSRKSTNDEKHKIEEDLKALLEATIEEKGESLHQVKWIDEDRVELNTISGLALHSFLLKVEQLGKSIQYTKTTKIEII